MLILFILFRAVLSSIDCTSTTTHCVGPGEEYESLQYALFALSAPSDRIVLKGDISTTFSIRFDDYTSVTGNGQFMVEILPDDGLDVTWTFRGTSPTALSSDTMTSYFRIWSGSAGGNLTLRFEPDCGSDYYLLHNNVHTFLFEGVTFDFRSSCHAITRFNGIFLDCRFLGSGSFEKHRMEPVDDFYATQFEGCYFENLTVGPFHYWFAPLGAIYKSPRPLPRPSILRNTNLHYFASEDRIQHFRALVLDNSSFFTSSSTERKAAMFDSCIFLDDGGDSIEGFFPVECGTVVQNSLFYGYTRDTLPIGALSFEEGLATVPKDCQVKFYNNIFVPASLDLSPDFSLISIQIPSETLLSLWDTTLVSWRSNRFGFNERPSSDSDSIFWGHSDHSGFSAIRHVQEAGNEFSDLTFPVATNADPTERFAPSYVSRGDFIGGVSTTRDIRGVYRDVETIERGPIQYGGCLQPMYGPGCLLEEPDSSGVSDEDDLIAVWIGIGVSIPIVLVLVVTVVVILIIVFCVMNQRKRGRITAILRELETLDAIYAIPRAVLSPTGFLKLKSSLITAMKDQFGLVLIPESVVADQFSRWYAIRVKFTVQIDSIEVDGVIFTFEQSVPNHLLHPSLIEVTPGREGLLGKGSFGVVRKGVLRVGLRSEDVAIKKMLVSSLTIQEVEQEVKIMAELDHENVLRCLGCWVEVDCMHVVLEFAEEGDLWPWITRKRKAKEFDGRIVRRLILQIAQGMAHLHSSGIIHRDLKPENILVAKNGVLKICDLGLSRHEGSAVSGIAGTPGYIPVADDCMTEKVDVYSFGVVSWEISTFRRVRELVAGGDMVLAQSQLVQKMSQVKPDADEIQEQPDWLLAMIGRTLSDDADVRPSFSEILQEFDRNTM